MPKPTPISQLKFFIPSNVVFEDVQDAVIENFEASIRALESEGAMITRGVSSEFKEIETLAAHHGALVGPEALEVHWDLVHSKHATQMDQRVLERIISAENMSARDLIVVQRERARLIQENSQILGDQIVLFPTIPITAPELKPLEQDTNLYVRTNKLMLRNTALGNFLDWCGVALPNGIDQNQMPTSILMSMPSGRENDLLAAALTVEKLLQ
ncbi:amidase family protein [Psychrobacter sp. AOP7-A1-24]|uniref:amidase family protein n=1 Tax=Psychrobacter sp. AOP7-A1-24 TaxID=3457646 RepID=UPI00402B279A